VTLIPCSLIEKSAQTGVFAGSRTSAKSAEKTVSYIEEHVMWELRESIPEAAALEAVSLPDMLAAINKVTERKFINLLRGLFKGAHSTEFIYLAYLTGILPIKKIKTQSALNNFDEFTMLDAKTLAPYIGFTKNEVAGLRQSYGRNFSEVKRWYDGYLLGTEHIYNPTAVVSLMMWAPIKMTW
jgi:hypothetical protein